MLTALLIAAVAQQELSPQMLRPLVMTAARAALDAQTEVTDVLGLTLVHVPRGAITVEVTPLASTKSGRVPARVIIHVGDSSRALSAILVLTTYGDAWFVAHPMPAQAILEEKDLLKKRVPMEDGLAEAPLGSRLLHAKTPGEALRRWDIVKVAVVQTHARLMMWAHSGGVSASLPVEAREAGALGDTIHVFNLTANKVVLARVMNAKEVEVVQ